MFSNIRDFIALLDDASAAHSFVARSCGSFNDLNGDYYHSGMSAAYTEVADYLRSLLSEPDSEGGR